MAISLQRPPSIRPFLTALVGLATFAAMAVAQIAPAAAQQKGYGQTLGTTPLEQQIYDGGSGGPPKGSSLLDSTNPIDLMQKLRRATAMDDATSPSSAIDQALKDLDSQSASPTASSSASPRPLIVP
jgi:hypothetical protein